MAASKKDDPSAIDAQDLAASRARLALAAGDMGSWEWDIEAGTVTGDPIIGDFLGIDPDAQPWPVESVFAAMHPDDEPIVRKAVDAALERDIEYHTEFRIQQAGDKPDMWVGARGRVVSRAPDGTPLKMLGVNWDMSAEKAHEQKLAMLASEMDHRVKNAFAVMRALIRLAGKSALDVQSLASTLESQAIAMAEAHALSAKLSRSDDPAGSIRLREVLETPLRPWIDQSGPGSHVEVLVDAPDDVVLPGGMIAPVAMLVYELTTNASKHGPLGERGGKLDVSVRNEDGKVVLTWNETPSGQAGEAPAIPASALESRRFGSVLVKQCATTLAADTQRELTPDGLKFKMAIPLPISGNEEPAQSD